MKLCFAFKKQLTSNDQFEAKFCICHNSSAVVTYAKLCLNRIICVRNKAKPNFIDWLINQSWKKVPDHKKGSIPFYDPILCNPLEERIFKSYESPKLSFLHWIMVLMFMLTWSHFLPSWTGTALITKLVPSGTKPLPEPMLTCHQRGAVPHIISRGTSPEKPKKTITYEMTHMKLQTNLPGAKW